MNNSQKAKMWGRRCFIVAAVKIVLCLVSLLFSAPAPPPEIHIGFGWMKVGICVFTVGTSLIPFYKEVLLTSPERVDARRYVGFGFGLEGLSDIINATWPREWHIWLSPFTFLFVVFFLISLFHFQGPDDKPRKKRRFKAKWPAWAKKWSQIPRHHRPQPQPNPSPARVSVGGAPAWKTGAPRPAIPAGVFRLDAVRWLGRVDIRRSRASQRRPQASGFPPSRE